MSWDLTFIYEQELRSKTMNDIIRGFARPGVYNPNMYLYTKDNADSPGVYLKVLKGTTLMFANGKSVVEGIHNRDLDDVGEYLIKAVANADLDVQLISTASGQALLASEGGVGAPFAPILYVGAEYTYNPDVAASTEITITLYRPNYENLNIAANVDAFPNEDLSTGSGSYSENTSFLIMGTILNTRVDDMISYYAGSLWSVDGEARWLKDNVFTAKGLPDYARSISREFQTDLPDLIYAREIDKLFLTDGAINYNGAIYKIDGKTWRSQYGSAGVPYETDDPNVNQGFLIDQSYVDDTQDAWGAEGLTTDTPDKLYVSIVYLGLKGKSAESTDPTLSTLLNVGNDDATFKLLPITIEMDANALETNTNSGNLNTELFGGTASIIPLDACTVNISRLKNVFNNKALFHKVVDYMRRNEDFKPYLNPENGETLVPIFIGFRGTDGSGVFDDPQTVTSGGINPTNCLTMKDLQGMPVANLNNVIENVYDIISIID